MADINHRSHLGVYALIYNDAQTHILLIKKARGPYTGLYDLPGGTMEDGEMLDETLLREVLEETSCTVEGHDQIGAFSTLFEYNASNNEPTLFRHVGIIYATTITGTPRTDPDGHDSHGCVWIALADITAQNSAPLVLTAIKS